MKKEGSGPRESRQRGVRGIYQAGITASAGVQVQVDFVLIKDIQVLQYRWKRSQDGKSRG